MEDASSVERDAMKIALILMVRNESKILERCLKAVGGAVDAVCIHDTGSTDNTVEIAKNWVKTQPGCLSESEWENFGYNRTMSFLTAKAFVRDVLKWDMKESYGLLLDADMVFVPGTIRDKPLTETGYTVLQRNGGLEYPNCRLIRMDYNWICKGVTHEYWCGPTFPLEKSVCYIEDQNDGGCKSDKFERDARLLEQGLLDEPDNVRYMFYLAQTYHSLGRLKDSIKMYKKRYAAGGWFEEQWYSLYMIGQSWLTLGNPRKFEDYMLRAYDMRSSRSEPLWRLSKYFREKGQHYKAYQYASMGRKIPLSTDSLFIETDVYKDKFEYELTILDYYVGKQREGLIRCMNYMMTDKENVSGVFQNLGFYIDPIGKEFTNHPALRHVFGREFHPSSVSSVDEYENIRFVNYLIRKDGGYHMFDGDGSRISTQNMAYSRDVYTKMNDASVSVPRNESTNIAGLEDVRIYKDVNQDLRFVATTKEYSDNIRILEGRYDAKTGDYSDCTLLNSPLNADCEKNWIPVSGTKDIIYSWNPLRVGTIEGSDLKFHTTHETPWFFKHLRGSAVPSRVGDELWCLVHFVEYSTPRKYYHCIVALDGTTYKPKSVSLPFSFRAKGIEYCLSMSIKDKNMKFIFSSWDDNPCITHVPVSALEWLQVQV